MIRFVKENGLLYAFGLAIFFSLVHYKGFDKDAAIYLLQVINYLQPERFVNDVPFMFGNQDSFSIFSPIIAFVLKTLGVNNGGIVATFFTLLALGTALIVLVCTWGQLFNAESWRVPIVFALFILLADKMYGSGYFYLPLFEPYLVARVLSEVLMIAGLTFLFNKNHYSSLAFFIMATLMHPLMGGWALLLWIFYHFPKVRVPVLVLAFLAPLSGFLHTGRLDFYPDDWKPLYISPIWGDFVIYLGNLAFWLAMYRHFKGSLLSKFSISLFWVSLIGFYLQFAGSYLEHILLYQAQPFRVQWLCQIPVIPVCALFVRDFLKENRNHVLRDYAGFVLGLCSIAGFQWLEQSVVAGGILLFLQVTCLILVYAPTRKYKNVQLPYIWIRILFFFSLIFLLASSVVNNFFKLAVEQGFGNAGLVVSWLNLPNYLSVVEMLLLLSLSLVCLIQKKYWFALLFAVSFCDGNLKMLPIVGLILCLIPNLGHMTRNILLSFSFSFSFFEIWNSLYQFNSTEKLPLEGNPFASVSLFLILTVVFCWLLSLRDCRTTKKTLIPLLVLFISFVAWDIYKWDSRDTATVVNERQMDSFFENMIFPQVRDRGKLLFAVDYESPMQSRINFMTGAYADESIYVGEIFYKEQYMESNRRRKALLMGKSQKGSLVNFGAQMMRVYVNPDTLLSRVHYLCGEGEITHFATDYANMPLPKEDSVFLDVKQKYVWLYGCPK